MNLLKSKEVIKKLNIGYDKFRKEVKHQPDFPKAVKLTQKSREQWDEEDIDNYLKLKKAA